MIQSCVRSILAGNFATLRRVKYFLHFIRWLASASPRWNRELVETLEAVGRPGEIDLDDPYERTEYGVTKFQVGSGGTHECVFAGDNRIYRFAWPDLCVYRIPGGVLDTRSGLSFVEGRVVVQANLGFRDSRDSAFVTGAYRRVIQKTPHIFSTPIASLGRTDNFYHFMIESLPRIIAINAVEPTAQFVTSTDFSGFSQEVCALLGLPILIAELDIPLHSHSVLVSTPPQLRQPSRAAISLLKSAFETFIEPTEKKMIYISRRFGSRSFAYEYDLEEFLTKRGFHIVYLEDMSIAEQVYMMSSAELVIAPHGAGLTHMIFMRPFTTIIELATSSHWHSSFRYLSSILDIDFETINIDDLELKDLLELLRARISTLNM